MTANPNPESNAGKPNFNRSKESADKVTQDAAKMVEEATKRFEESTERMKEFTSAMMESSKTSGRVVVDNYETAANSIFSMQREMAGTSQVDWVRDTANTQIQFAEEVTGAWVKAARELLK
ncbi:hypothetical protein GCM10022261_24710 [Brevibacterium daeguense]|uniref:Phasin domain-containing protein n=1 Tax=Brevibacterium daeguense TaxID=909936 RepID=A0ABP8EM36_9MICO|nr:hypothetical protein [Brevibacterium daeguense]